MRVGRQEFVAVTRTQRFSSQLLSNMSVPVPNLPGTEPFDQTITNGRDYSRTRGAVPQINPEFLFGALLNPQRGIRAGTKCLRFPSHLFHKCFPHACDSKTYISRRADGEKRSWRGAGRKTLVLLYNAGHFSIIQVHAFNSGEIDDRVSPLPELVRKIQEAVAGIIKILQGHRTVAIIDNARAFMKSFDVDRHRLAITPFPRALQILKAHLFYYMFASLAASQEDTPEPSNCLTIADKCTSRG